MEQDQFRSLALRWLGASAAFIVLSSFLMPVLFRSIAGSAENLQGIWAFLVVAFVYGLFIFILVIGIGWITHKRMRSFNYGSGWTVLLIFWLLDAFCYISALGVTYFSKLKLEFLFSKPPVLLPFLLVFIIALAMRKDTASNSLNGVGTNVRLIASIGAGHAVLLSFWSAYLALSSIPFIGTELLGDFLPTPAGVFSFTQIVTLGFSYSTILFVDLFIFTGALIYMQNVQASDDVLIEQLSDGQTREIHDFVFWPVVSACVIIVGFGFVQFAVQPNVDVSKSAVEYIDAQGRPLSADKIRQIEKAN